MFDLFLTVLIFGWPICGIIANIQQANEMVTWCGTPVWEEPTTWGMFFPAMILGPFAFLSFEEYPDRHPERKSEMK